MPLYPRTLSHYPGGISLSALPNPAVNVALTTGLFSLQPAVRLYTPYDQVSSYALKHLGVLVVVGGAVKVALSTYRDVVMLESPLDTVVVSEAASAGGFILVGRGSGAGLAKDNLRRYSNGVEFAVGEALGNISGDIDNTMYNISLNVGLGYFGPFLDISAGITVHDDQDISDTSLANPLLRGLAYISKERSISLNFVEIVAQGKCLQGSAADVSTIEGVFVAGVVSLGEVPNASRVVDFTQSASPFIYYNSNILGGNTTPASPLFTLWDEDKAASRESVVDSRIPLVFLGLITILGLTLKPRRVALKPLVSVHVQRHIPKGPVPQWYLLEEEKLKGLEHRLQYLDGCTCYQYVEVWYSKKTMDSVNKFIANGCKFLPAQSSMESRPFGPLKMRLLLYFMDYFLVLVVCAWLACKYLGREYITGKLEEIIAKFPLPDDAVRPATKVKGRKRRRRGRRNKLGAQEFFGTRPEGVHIPRVLDVPCPGSMGQSLTRNANDGIGDSLDFEPWIIGSFRD